MATGSNILAWKNSMDRGAWRAHGVAELDTTEHTHTHTHAHNRRIQYAELLRESWFQEPLSRPVCHRILFGGSYLSQRMRRLDGINEHEFEQTLGDNEGQGSLSTGSQRVGQD